MNEQHIVITGGSRGIGKGLASEFLKAGCRVTIGARNSVQLKKTIEEFKQKYGDRIAGFVTDVTDRVTIQALCHRAVSIHGDIDIWINNAGVDQKRQNFWEIKEEDCRMVFDVNLNGTISGCTVAVKQMMEQGFGRIYNMEGLGSDGRKVDKFSFYGASKRAVSYITESFALELKNTPVKIAVLSPGMVVTDFLVKGLPENPDEREKRKRMYNILADKPEDVTAFLSAGILADNRGGRNITWLTGKKAAFRFLTSPFVKRDLFEPGV